MRCDLARWPRADGTGEEFQRADLRVIVAGAKAGRSSDAAH